MVALSEMLALIALELDHRSKVHADCALVQWQLILKPSGGTAEAGLVVTRIVAVRMWPLQFCLFSAFLQLHIKRASS